MSQQQATDHEFMQLALEQARAASAAGEVPVGAVVVRNGEVIAAAHNAPLSMHDPTAHAEVNALRAAAQTLGNYRLDGCTLYVTLEPCAMCSGAALHARLDRVVYGATEPRTGAAGSVIDLFANTQLNHQTQITAGVLAQECADVMRQFFETRRTEQQTTRMPLREDALRTPATRFASLGLPLHMSRYTTSLPSLEGLRLHWFDNRSEPDTPPILYLHGPEDWSARYIGQLQLPTPAIALDWIGFGLSDKPKKEAFHTPAWHARMLSEFLDSISPHPTALVMPNTLSSLWGALPAHWQKIPVSWTDNPQTSIKREWLMRLIRIADIRRGRVHGAHGQPSSSPADPSPSQEPQNLRQVVPLRQSRHG